MKGKFYILTTLASLSFFAATSVCASEQPSIEEVVTGSVKAAVLNLSSKSGKDAQLLVPVEAGKGEETKVVSLEEGSPDVPTAPSLWARLGSAGSSWLSGRYSTPSRSLAAGALWATANLAGYALPYCGYNMGALAMVAGNIAQSAVSFYFQMSLVNDAKKFLGETFGPKSTNPAQRYTFQPAYLLDGLLGGYALARVGHALVDPARESVKNSSLLSLLFPTELAGLSDAFSAVAASYSRVLLGLDLAFLAGEVGYAHARPLLYKAANKVGSALMVGAKSVGADKLVHALGRHFSMPKQLLEMGAYYGFWMALDSYAAPYAVDFWFYPMASKLMTARLNSWFLMAVANDTKKFIGEALSKKTPQGKRHFSNAGWAQSALTLRWRYEIAKVLLSPVLGALAHNPVSERIFAALSGTYRLMSPALDFAGVNPCHAISDGYTYVLDGLNTLPRNIGYAVVALDVPQMLYEVFKVRFGLWGSSADKTAATTCEQAAAGGTVHKGDTDNNKQAQAKKKTRPQKPYSWRRRVRTPTK